MIININNERRINYDNVIDEQLVEHRQTSVKIKFTFVNNSFVVLQMTEQNYTDFKNKTKFPIDNPVIDLKCVVVELLQG